MYGNILQVNILSGAHTNKVYFYSIDENGTLHDIKGGIMSSDGEDPIVNKDPYDSNIIKVYTTNWWDKKIDDKTSCRITTLDMYRYENGIFKHIIKDKEIYESCRSEK